jgi:Tfp pilus assembly protein PilO
MTFKERILLAAAVRPSWQRYTATALFLLIIILIWWFLSYRELYAQLQERLSSATQQKSESVTALPIAPELTKKSRFELVAQEFFVMPRMADMVQKLISSCQQYKLSIDSYTVADRQMMSWGFRMPIKLVVTGDFFNLLKFFEALQQVTNMVFESCEMSIVDEATLRCSCQLSVYTQTDLK